MAETTKPKKSPVTLTSYAIKAIIPTGPYANIQAEIVVEAKTLEDAKGYVIPHINTLFEEFLNKSDRPKPSVTVKDNKINTLVVESATSTPGTSGTILTPTVTVESTVSPAFKKASAAINSCVSPEALELVAKQVEASVKLTSKEKLELGTVIVSKGRELSAKK